MPSRLLISVLLASLVVLGAAPAAQAERKLTTGFFDNTVFVADAPGPWLDRTAALGGGLVRIDAGWPVRDRQTKPAGFDPRDPADPNYDFSRLDRAVIAAEQRGIIPMMGINGAPRWAEGPGRPADAPVGTWKPDPGEIRDLAFAVATRYSGDFQGLPRVRYFQLWNEQNQAQFLSPQYEDGAVFAPKHYRKMLHEFYGGIKRVDKGNVVVVGGTAPFGDPGRGRYARMPPARFVRVLLCLRGRREIKTVECDRPARFDRLSHHPYSVGSPQRSALNPDDVSIPDIGRLRRYLRFAEDNGRVHPQGRKLFWVTEISYDSNPPDPDGVPERQHAEWTAETMYELWRREIASITWFRIRDDPATPDDFTLSNQSGMFLLDGTPKLSARAFRFPFVADRLGERRLRFWAKVPRKGTVRVQVRRGDAWETVLSERVAQAGDVVDLRLRRGAGGTFRALVGDEESLSSSVE
jgi:hypothetical protein